MMTDLMDVLPRDGAEERLGIPAEQFQVLADLMPGIVWTALPDGTADYVNEQWYEFTGCGRETPVSEAFFAALHPDDVERATASWAEARRGGAPCEIELRLRNAHGDYHWFSTRGLPVRDRAGEIVKWVGTAADITESKPAEEALREQQRFTQSIIEAAPSLTYIYDIVNSRNFYVSDQTLKILGYTVEEIAAMGTELLAILLHPDDAPRADDRFAKILADRSDEIFELEYRMRRKDGEWVCLFDRACVFRRNAEGRATQILGVATDITTRKRAEESLRESEQRFRTMADTLPLLIWVTDAAGRLEMVNRAYCEFFGVTEEEVRGPNWQALIHPDDAEQYVAAFLASLRERKAFRGQTRARRADGEWRWIESYSAPRFSATGEFIGAVGSSPDITERKHAEDALRESEERQAFLLKLSDRLRPLADSEEIQYEAACVLGEYLRADRVGYAEDQNDGETVEVTRNYTNGVPGIEGRYRYLDYGPGLLAELQAGRMVVRPDIANDPLLTPAEKEAHAALQLGATVNVPLAKAGRLTAILFIHCRKAHAWPARTLALIQETAERTWAAMERARAEKALRESEERFHSLFDSIDEGFVIIEAIFDDGDHPRDYRFLQANPQFTRLTGLPKDALGKTARELIPNLEEFWFETYGRVALTGKAARFENKSEPMNRWFDVYASRVGGADSRRVAIVFNDITARKQAEELTRKSEERFRLASVAAGALVYDLDLTGKRHVIVHGLERVTGYPAGDATLNGEWWRALIHPEDLPAHLEALARHLETGERYRAAYRIRRKDGSWIWVEDTAQVVRNTNGEAVQLVGAIVDVTARREAEREQRKFVSLVENSTDFIATCDLGFKPTYANNAAFRLLGLKDRETARQLPFKDFFFAEDWEFIQREFLPRVLREGRAETEIRLRNLRNGTASWVLYNLFKIQDEQGRPMGLATVSKNITERKLQEERLRESEEKFRSMANTTPAIIWTAAPDGRITFHNQQWLDYTGLTPEQNESNWGKIVLHPDDYEPCLRAWRQALERGEKYEIEVRNRRHDGEYRWFLTRAVPVRNAAGEIVSWFGSTTDIHQQKLAEEQIRTANYRFRVAEEAANGLNYDWNLETGHVTRSESIERVLGYKKEDLGTSWQAWAELIHPDDKLVWSEAESQQFLSRMTEDSFSGEYRVRHKDGHYLWVMERGLILRDEQGNPRRVIGQTVDISERKRLEAERERLLAEEQKARAQAEAATRAKDEFLAMVTHELKTPLNSINGWAELLRGGRLSDDDARQAVETIVRNAKVQKQLIDDLLDISRIVSGKMRLNVRDVSLPDVLRAAVETVQHAAQVKHIRLRAAVPDETGRRGDGETGRGGGGGTEGWRDGEMGRKEEMEMEGWREEKFPPSLHPYVPSSSSPSIPPSPPPPRSPSLHPASLGLQVRGDFDRLQQVIWNLLANAIKFTPEHGQVDVILRRVEGQAEIVVRDTGKGIKPEFLPFVFDRFRQENAAISRSEGGLGLGLAIVRQLVELHGGTVCAESPGQGRGATFTISLPLREAEPDENRQADRQSANRGGGESKRIAGLRVLAVDDEAEARLLLRVILEGDGAEVRTAGNAAEAHKLLDEWKPDVIVADMGMPEVDGYEFIRQVRQRDRDGGGLVPAVALTAYSRTEDRVQALSAGYQAHLAKPVEPDALLVLVAGLTGRSLSA